MASTVRLSGLQAFHLRCHSSSNPQPKTLTLPFASSSAYAHLASSLRSLRLTSRRRRNFFVPSTTSGTLFATASIKKLSDTELVSIPSGSEGIEGLFPPGAGVYGIYDKSGDLQFIGISRNVGASISAHRKTVPVLCCSVKVTFPIIQWSYYSFIFGAVWLQDLNMLPGFRLHLGKLNHINPTTLSRSWIPFRFTRFNNPTCSQTTPLSFKLWLDEKV